MNPDALFTKQSAALASLAVSIANALVAFGVFNATLAALLQAASAGIASLVLYLLHLKDKAA